MSINDTEAAVLQLLLAGDDPVLKILREQLSQAAVRKRELTGCGFFCYFDVGGAAPKLTGRQRFQFGDVEGRIIGLNHGAGFLLFVSDGTLDFLEGYTFGETWPQNARLVSASYSNGPQRVLDEVKKAWTEPS